MSAGGVYDPGGTGLLVPRRVGVLSGKVDFDFLRLGCRLVGRWGFVVGAVRDGGEYGKGLFSFGSAWRKGEAVGAVTVVDGGGRCVNRAFVPCRLFHVGRGPE